VRPARLSAAALIVGLCVAGCGGRIPTTHYYLLETQDVARSVPASGLTIGVPPLRVAVPYDQDRIVYRVGESSVEVGFYAYHRWAAPLGRMLPPIIVEACQDLTGVQRIEPAEADRQYDAYLHGRLTTLEEIDTPDGVRVLVRLDLRLVRNGVTVWSETVEHETPIDGNDMPDVVQGMASSIRTAVQTVQPALHDALVD
jgi:uncharacterized lipoprotein YmbA